jgi:hypothetical protein
VPPELGRACCFEQSAEASRVALVEVDGCIYDDASLKRSHGYESMDSVGREAFVNHIHLQTDDRVKEAERIIATWIKELRTRWPLRAFRIYRHTAATEIIIRFHMIRPDAPNWYEAGCNEVEVMEVRPPDDS